MKAVEFQSELDAHHSIHVPDHVAAGIPLGQSVRVLVLIPTEAADLGWEQLAATEFGQGYADSDAIYDQLSAGRPGPR